MIWRHTAGYLVLACCLSTPPAARRDENSSWVDRRVLIKSTGLKIRDGGKEVATLTDLLYTVKAEDGGRIKVSHRGVAGWLAKADAVPLEEAVPHFTERTREDSRDAAAFASRALALLERGRVDEAARDSERAVRLRPDVGQFYYVRGVIRHAQGEDGKAAADYGEAIRLDPTYPNPSIRRGQLRFAQGKYRAAIADYDRACRAAPEGSGAYLLRGRAWAALREYDKAIADYGEAIRLGPFPWAFACRADAWRNKGDYGKALADYEEAVRLTPRFDPPDVDVMTNRAWIMAVCPDGKYRDGKKAVELARRACELTDWCQAPYLDTLAAAYAEAGEFQQAVKYQKKALACPDFAEQQKEAGRKRLKLYEEGKPCREPEHRGGGAPRPDGR
jgi:tetratricopeptide (TPR) repeat protein